MIDKIINVSIRGLQTDGLRFSVDDIAKELKISKKTVYKYFSKKEDLAVAVYEKFYDDLNQELNDAISSCGKGVFCQTIAIYYRSYCMIREELFNKYALNASIRELALNKHRIVREKFQSVLTPDEREIITLIIEGTFDKLKGERLSPKITEKLERIIC
ncbi:MAG: TetR/AcrR family transcriptional regulator [Christensenellaceae bacterium]